MKVVLWRDRRARLESCIVNKNHYKWEVQYAEFDDYDGIPKKGSTLHTWQRNQLTGVDGKTKKENAANKGSTVWRDRT